MLKELKGAKNTKILLINISVYLKHTPTTIEVRITTAAMFFLHLGRLCDIY